MKDKLKGIVLIGGLLYASYKCAKTCVSIVYTIGYIDACEECLDRQKVKAAEFKSRIKERRFIN